VPGAIEDMRAFPGSRPQHLLTTLIGDYWFERDEPIATAGLIDLMAEFGVSEAAAIRALRRMAERGLLEAVGDGYRVAPQTMDMIGRGAGRIFTFGLGLSPWDGTWTSVGFAIPESRARIRSPLLRRLRWLGFAPLGAAWYAPGDRAEAAAALLAGFGVEQAAVSAGLVTGPDGENPLHAWDLDALRGRYEAFNRRFEPVCDRAAELGYAESLLIRTALIDIFRHFLAHDPELPAKLLPADWPVPETGRLFRTIYDTSGPRALKRFREVLARHDPAAAELATYHVSSSYHVWRDAASQPVRQSVGQPVRPPARRIPSSGLSLAA
jgi:phenylacetic acid degradation operon negative regulatory protein